jgi:hypothetical protein
MFMVVFWLYLHLLAPLPPPTALFVTLSPIFGGLTVPHFWTIHVIHRIVRQLSITLLYRFIKRR